MWSRCIAAAAGAVATRRRAYAANDDEGTPATTLVGAGALPNYSLRLSIVHFALILHAAAGPSGRVSPIDSSGSRSIRTGASIPVAPPVKQTNLMSFFAANSARTVVARDKPVVVASQAMDVGNRWWDDDEEVQIDEEAEKKERNKRAYESAQEWAKFFLRVTPPAPAASSSSTTLRAWIANTVTMDGKVKKAMKAVNTTDVSAAKGASTVTAVESDSGTGSDAE